MINFLKMKTLSCISYWTQWISLAAARKLDELNLQKARKRDEKENPKT